MAPVWFPCIFWESCDICSGTVPRCCDCSLIFNHVVATGRGATSTGLACGNLGGLDMGACGTLVVQTSVPVVHLWLTHGCQWYHCGLHMVPVVPLWLTHGCVWYPCRLHMGAMQLERRKIRRAPWYVGLAKYVTVTNRFCRLLRYPWSPEFLYIHCR